MQIDPSDPRKANIWCLKNLGIKNDDISVSDWKPRRRDMHHFVYPPTNLKIYENDNYPHIPHDNRNNLTWPKKWFSDFVRSKTTMSSGNSLDFWYCTPTPKTCCVSCITLLYISCVIHHYRTRKKLFELVVIGRLTLLSLEILIQLNQLALLPIELLLH